MRISDSGVDDFFDCEAHTSVIRRQSMQSTFYTCTLLTAACSQVKIFVAVASQSHRSHRITDFFRRVSLALCASVSDMQQELSSFWDGRRFGHNRRAGKWGAGVSFSVGEYGSPSNTMSPGPGLPPCQASSWSTQPFGHNTPTLQIGQTERTDNGPIA